MRKRKPNIANTLVKNSLDGFITSIELHNKPNYSYRFQSCGILLSHSWEILLKAYCYKYLKKKKILEKDSEGKYTSFSNVIDMVYHTNPTRFRIMKENLLSLNDYRNLIIHSYIDEDLGQLVYEIISKSVLLYRDFVQDFFVKYSLSGIEDTFILPISFKLPLTSIDILTKNYSSENTSRDVIEFINSINSRIELLSQDGFEENIFIGIKTEFVNQNNMDNSNIIAAINQNAEDSIQFKRQSNVRFVNDPGIQVTRSMLTDQEIESNFPISTKKELTKIVKDMVGNKWNIKKGLPFFSIITRELQLTSRGELWYPNPINGGKRFSNEFLDIIIEKYD